mmetsp:Transcript_68377/g.162131  ORF Transcript_68377/g.162131 Transcript_68377/m.162131 type:complete len:209 (-) Transcript_68377:72-698(-)
MAGYVTRSSTSAAAAATAAAAAVGRARFEGGARRAFSLLYASGFNTTAMEHAGSRNSEVSSSPAPCSVSCISSRVNTSASKSSSTLVETRIPGCPPHPASSLSSDRKSPAARAASWASCAESSCAANSECEKMVPMTQASSSRGTRINVRLSAATEMVSRRRSSSVSTSPVEARIRHVRSGAKDKGLSVARPSCWTPNVAAALISRTE